MSLPLKSVVRRIRIYARFHEIQLEIDEELQFHIEMRTQDNLKAGLTPEEARVDALKRFGNYQKIKKDCYAIGDKGSLTKMGVRAIIPLILVFGGLILTIWAMNQPSYSLRLLCVMSAVFIAFISLALVPGAFHRLPTDKSELSLGLAEEGISTLEGVNPPTSPH